jgi:hypothetical protein
MWVIERGSKVRFQLGDEVLTGDVIWADSRTQPPTLHVAIDLVERGSRIEMIPPGAAVEELRLRDESTVSRTTRETVSEPHGQGEM